MTRLFNRTELLAFMHNVKTPTCKYIKTFGGD